MDESHIKTNKWLLPLSWLYGLGVRTRNLLYDIGAKKSRAFSVPVIAVGNITVGGTGKTPHVEYLVKLLKGRFRVAVLSRGYKRKTKGFVLADAKANAQTIGDEPMQMARKFPDVAIAVDENRCRGICRLTEGVKGSKTDVVVLDDAFQHRHVKPGVNILLVDYHRMITHDLLLPAGRLREPASGKNRADIVIVSKCPKNLKPVEYRVMTKTLGLYPYQKLFFTSLDYGNLQPMYCGEELPLSALGGQHVLLLTGIASPRLMQAHLETFTKDIHPLAFADHHAFSPKDIERINAEYEAMAKPGIIITTEKDAARLFGTQGLSDNVRRALFVLPVRVAFMLGQEESFNETIIGYVFKNSRNSVLAKAKDAKQAKDGDNTGDGTRTISFRDS